jgi:hypothetical protein
MLMTLVSSGVTGRQDGTHPWWAPRWLRREREERRLTRWATELSWQWSDVMEGVNLTRHSSTAGKISLTVAPQVHSVDMGPPVTLLVEMLSGQVAEDFQAQANRIAESMGVASVHIAPYDLGWITVALLEEEPESSAEPPPTDDPDR